LQRQTQNKADNVSITVILWYGYVAIIAQEKQ